MSHWKILGVEPGADKKTIKLAYAKLLKKTRPDDDPEGFTTLHKAYKAALANSGSAASTASSHPNVQSNTTGQPPSVAAVTTNNEIPVTNYADSKNEVVVPKPTAHGDQTPTDDNQIVTTLKAPEAINPSESELDEEEQSSKNSNPEEDTFHDAEYQQKLLKDIDLIRQKVAELVETKKLANNIEQWRFIESVESMVDLDFSSQASDIIFAAISQANVESLRQGDLHIKRPVLRYLNDYFQWEKNWQHYEGSYGSDRSNTIFRFINSNPVKNKKSALHYFSRIIAFSVDLILPGICFYVSINVPVLSFLKFVPMIYFLLAIPILEASSLQASLGKKMFQLKVVDKDGLRLRWYHSFFRSYVSYGCIAALKIVIWINIFTSYKYNALLQDIISRSHVVGSTD